MDEHIDTDVQTQGNGSFMTRRNFLKGLGLAGLGVAVSGCVGDLKAPGLSNLITAVGERLGSEGSLTEQEQVVFDEIQRAYEGYGLPSPYDIGFYNRMSIENTEPQVPPPPEKIRIITPTQKDAKVGIDVAKTAYTMFGPDVAHNYLREVFVIPSGDGIVAHPVSLGIITPTNHDMPVYVHELVHLVDSSMFGGMEPRSKILNKELLKVNALLAAGGIFETYSKYYLGSDDTDSALRNFYIWLAREIMFDAPYGLRKLTDLRDFVDMELKQQGLDGLTYEGGYVSSQIVKTLHKKEFDDSCARIGKELMRVIKPSPNDIPEDLKKTVMYRCQRIVSEAWAALAERFLTNFDPSLEESNKYIAEYLLLTRNETSHNGDSQTFFAGVRDALRNPPDYDIPYEIQLKELGDPKK